VVLTAAAAAAAVAVAAVGEPWTTMMWALVGFLFVAWLRRRRRRRRRWKI